MTFSKQRRSARRRVVAFETLEPRLPLANDLAVVEMGSAESILDPLANDGFEQSNQPVIEAIIGSAAHGVASIAFEGTRIKYAPNPDFIGQDSLRYRAVDATGRVVESEIQIEVGAAAVPAEKLIQWEAATAAANDAWLEQLESDNSNDLEVPVGGVLIDREVIISQAKAVRGEGRELHFVGDGRLLIQLPDSSHEFSISNANIQWRSANPQRSLIEVASGKLNANQNQLSVISKHAAPTYLLDVKGDSASADISHNEFTNAYWNATNLVKVDSNAGGGFKFIGNEVSYFQDVIDAARTQGGIIQDNNLFRNTGVQVRLDDAQSTTIQGNRFQLPGDSVVLAQDVQQLVLSDNVLANSESSAVVIGGPSQMIEIARNFIHGSRGEAIRFEGAESTPIQQVALVENIIAQNGGLALFAQHVHDISLNENLIHQNSVVANAMQHQFESVSNILEQGNLQDQDNTSADATVRKTYGSNAQSYSFLADDNTPVPETNRLAFDPATINALRPTATASESEAFLVALQGGGEFTVPANGVTIDRPVTLRQPTEIVGGGAIEIVEGGELIVAMDDESDAFILRDATLIWSLALGEPSEVVNAIHFRTGKITLENNEFFSLVKPSEAHHEDQNELFFNSAPSSFIRLGQANGTLHDLRVSDNRFVNGYWYATQLIHSSTGITLTNAVFTDNAIRNFHGAVYLYGLDNADVSNNYLFRNSFGNILVTGQNIRVAKNRIVFPGNGTSGDGITFGESRNVTVENNVVSNGTCYSVWFLHLAQDVVVKGNVFHAGITSAINFDPTTIVALGIDIGEHDYSLYEFDSILIAENLMSHNAGLATRIVETRGVELTRNIWQANNSGGAQHLFLAVLDYQESENFLAHDRNGAALTGADPHHMKSPHFVLQGKTLNVYGSTEADNFEVDPAYRGVLRVRWGQFDASYAHDAVDSIRLVSEGGDDFTRQHPFESPFDAAFYPGLVHSTNDEFDITLVGMASVQVENNSMENANQAIFHDSASSDTLYLRDNYARLRNSQSDYRANRFAATRAEMNAGGSDRIDAYFAQASPIQVQLGQTMQIQSGQSAHTVITNNQQTTSITGGADANIELQGTAGRDSVELAANGGLLSGDGYRVSLSSFESIAVDGNGGPDKATLLGSPEMDVLWARPNYSHLSGNGYQNLVTGFPLVESIANGGDDLARLFGSEGNDLFNASPDQAELIGDGFRYKAIGYERVLAQAAGGEDTAYIVDSIQNDVFVGRENYAYMQGDQFLIQADAFDRVTGVSTSGQDDAFLYDSEGDDRFIGRTSYSFLEGQDFLNEARGFPRVHGFASIGRDEAKLFDSPDDDRLVGRPGYAYILTPVGQNIAQGFDVVEGIASLGEDHALFSDSTGADLFVGRDRYSYMQGPGFLNQATNFDKTVATGYFGGGDLAKLFDSPEDDTFVARSSNAYMRNSQRLNEAIAFPTVIARSIHGGNDRASFFASEGRDEFVARPSYAYLAGPDFLNQAEGFSEVEALRGSVNDVARLYGSANDDHVNGDFQRVNFNGSNYFYQTSGFGQVLVFGMGSQGTDSVQWRGGPLASQAVSRANYDYLQAGDLLLQAHDFGLVDLFGEADDDDADLFGSTTPDVLSTTADTTTLTRAAKQTTLHQFSRVRAVANNGQSPRAENSDAADFILELVGDWTS